MKKFLLLVLNMAAAVSLFTFSTSASAQIGSLSKDLVFTPLAPCRIMDTRNPGGISGPILAGTTRTFNGNGTGTNYTSQGGLLTTCGLPFTSDVAAIVLNVTVTQPAAAGYITVFPADAAQPLASSVNFTAGADVANNATLKISQANANGQFKIFSITNVHVIADVVGYYAKPIAGALSFTSVTGATVSVAANTEANSGTLSCPVGFTAVAFSITGSAQLVMKDSTLGATSGNFWVHNLSAAAQSFNGKLNCIQIPGR